MKTILFLIFFLSVLSAQEGIMIYKNDYSWLLAQDCATGKITFSENFENTIIETLLDKLTEYEKEYTDTIKAIYNKTLENYLVDRGNYVEAFSKDQLDGMDYKFKYRWVIKTDPFEFEYVFIKELTFTGFIEFLKTKTGVK